MWIEKAGYSLRDLTEKQLRKDGYLAGLACVTDVDRLRARALAAIAGQGVCFRLMHKGRVVGCLVFVREETPAEALAAAHPEVEGQLKHVREPEGTVTVLRMAERLTAPGHEQGLDGLEHYRGLVMETGALLNQLHLSAMLWNDVCWLPSEGSARFSGAGYLCGMAVGMALGAAMGKLPLGICFGACFAMLFGIAMPAYLEANSKKKE